MVCVDLLSSESLMALPIVSLLFVVMLSRASDQEVWEIERRAEAFLYDTASAALILNQTLKQTGA